MTAFDKAWSLVKKLSDYEMAVAEEYSDPRDFMANRRMREVLAGMPYSEVVNIANHPQGDLDFRYMSANTDGRGIEMLADDEVKDIYNQMMRLNISKGIGGSSRYDDKKYKIVRMYFSDNKRNRTIKSGLTLEEAQAHCRDPATSNADAENPEDKWFDGYEEM